MSDTIRSLPADKLIDARCTAEMIFKNMVSEQTKPSDLRRLADLAIESAAVFWEQWTIAAMNEQFVKAHIEENVCQKQQ